MITLADVEAARRVGCTCRPIETTQLLDKDGQPIPGMSVSRTRSMCSQPASWAGEWWDADPNARPDEEKTKGEWMLGAACAVHHEQILSGEYLLEDRLHRRAAADWYRLPADPDGDEKWVAELIAAAEREDHAMDDVEVPERVGANDRLEVFPGKDGKFYFRRIAEGNSEPIARGQGYTEREHAVTGARRAFPDIAERVELVDE